MDRPLSRHNLSTTIGSNVRLARLYRNTAFQQSGQRTRLPPVRINCRQHTLDNFPFVSVLIRSHQQQACNNDAVTAVQHNTHNHPFDQKTSKTPQKTNESKLVHQDQIKAKTSNQVYIFTGITFSLSIPGMQHTSSSAGFSTPTNEGAKWHSNSNPDKCDF